MKIRIENINYCIFDDKTASLESIASFDEDRDFQETGFNNRISLKLDSTIEYDHETYSLTSFKQMAFCRAPQSIVNISIHSESIKILPKCLFSNSFIESFDFHLMNLEFIDDMCFSGSKNLNQVSLKSDNFLSDENNCIFDINHTILYFVGRETQFLKNLPQSLVMINDYALENCTKLQQVEFSNLKKLTVLGKAAFKNCSELTLFRCPSNLETISENCFENSRSLSRVNINNKKLQRIKIEAFKNCISLNDFCIDKPTALRVESKVFKGCVSLKKIYVENYNFDLRNSIDERYTRIKYTTICYTADSDLDKNGYLYRDLEKARNLMEKIFTTFSEGDNKKIEKFLKILKSDDESVQIDEYKGKIDSFLTDKLVRYSRMLTILEAETPPTDTDELLALKVDHYLMENEELQNANNELNNQIEIFRLKESDENKLNDRINHLKFVITDLDQQIGRLKSTNLNLENEKNDFKQKYNNLLKSSFNLVCSKDDSMTKRDDDVSGDESYNYDDYAPKSEPENKFKQGILILNPNDFKTVSSYQMRKDKFYVTERVTNTLSNLQYVKKTFVFPIGEIENIPEYNRTFIHHTFSHPLIAQIIGKTDSSKYGESYYTIYYPYTLKQLLKDDTLCHTRLSIITAQICLGLKFLEEKGIHHISLKANNILLTDDYQVKLTDFINHTTCLDLFTFGKKKLRIYPKEVLCDNDFTSSNFDVYAFGLLLYQIVMRGEKINVMPDKVIIGQKLDILNETYVNGMEDWVLGVIKGCLYPKKSLNKNDEYVVDYEDEYNDKVDDEIRWDGFARVLDEMKKNNFRLFKDADKLLIANSLLPFKSMM